MLCSELCGEIKFMNYILMGLLILMGILIIVSIVFLVTLICKRNENKKKAAIENEYNQSNYNQSLAPRKAASIKNIPASSDYYTTLDNNETKALTKGIAKVELNDPFLKSAEIINSKFYFCFKFECSRYICFNLIRPNSC